MSSASKLQHPQPFHAPPWHGEAQTPVIDGKYHDPATGALREDAQNDHPGCYGGPPEVDIIIKSIHEDTTHCVYRGSRPFRVEVLLCRMMQTVHTRKLKLDSLTATPYAIRIILAHDLTVEEFNTVADELANGIWGEVTAMS